jgi:hypothetical protein
VTQIARVHGLLHGIGTTPAPLIEVTTVNGKTFRGQLLRDLVGNKQSAKGWSSYGSITLATQEGTVEIDYLDIVSVGKQSSCAEKQSVWLRPRRAPHMRSRTGIQLTIHLRKFSERAHAS